MKLIFTKLDTYRKCPLRYRLCYQEKLPEVARGGRKRLDVFAHVDSLRVVLKGLSGFHRRARPSRTPTPAAPETHHRSTPVF